jgi:tetratricopeptide (TPR) repeat protein
MKVKSFVVAFFATILVSGAVLAQDNEIGLKAMNAEKYCLARSIFEKIATTNPTMGNYYLGQMSLQMGKPDEAKLFFDKGVAADAKNNLNKVGQAAVMIAKGDLNAGKAAIDELLKLTKNKDVEVLLAAGKVYTGYMGVSDKMKPLYKADPAEAIRLADLAKDALSKGKLNPRQEVGLIKGDANLIKGEAGPAVSGFEEAISVNPGAGEAHVKIAKIYWGGRNFDAATRAFQNALDSAPDYAPASREFSGLYMFARGYKPAAKFMNAYIEKLGECATADDILESAKYDFIAGDNESVKTKLAKFENSTEPVVARMRGWSAYRTGDFKLAADNLDKFFKAAPQKAQLDDYRYFGQSLLKTTPADTARAVINLEKAAELDTVDNGYREIAKIYQAAKKNMEAAAYYEKSIKRDGARPSMNDMVSMGLMFYNQALGIKPKGADSLNMLTARRENFKKSIPSFERAIQKDSNYIAGYRYLGGATYYQYSQMEALENGLSMPYYEKYTRKVEAGDQKTKDDNKSQLVFAYRVLASYNVLTKKDNAKALEYYTKIVTLIPEDPNATTAIKDLTAPPPPPAKTATKPAAGAKPAPKAPAKKGK